MNEIEKVTRLKWEECDAHNCHCDIVESNDGDMVNYEDYVALAVEHKAAMDTCSSIGAIVGPSDTMSLSEQVAAIVAENVALKSFCKNAAFDADYEAELGMERGGFTDALNDIETPATDAVIADIEARGVEKAANEMQVSGAQSFGDCYIALINYSQQLRSGNVPAPDYSHSHAITDVIAERQRQITEEGRTAAHDDDYDCDELARAAGCYAMFNHHITPPPDWPWPAEWWKPASPRRDLVRAAALILAEIERIDRAELRSGKGAA